MSEELNLDQTRELKRQMQEERKKRYSNNVQQIMENKISSYLTLRNERVVGEQRKKIYLDSVQQEN